MDAENVTYEQPLNERVRAFLRLEFLFQKATYRLEGDSPWDSRASVAAVIDVLSFLGRADLRKELMKDLERHLTTLERLRSNPGVDPTRLAEVVSRAGRLIEALREEEGAPGTELRTHELLASVKQRLSIPAGTCSFDLPGYQYWLQRPSEERRAQLHGWLGEFVTIRDAVNLCLKLTRGGAQVSRQTADGGFFQHNVDPAAPCHLIRVTLASGTEYYPEISGGRHRFSIRFLRQPDPASRPSPVEEDVDFGLQCCLG